MFPQALDNSNKLAPILGAEGMRESRLEPSVLGSIIPSLDPDPPIPSRNNAFVVDSTPSPAGAGAKRPRPPVDPVVTGRLSAPVSGKGGPREWAEGATAATAVGEGGAGAGIAGGVVPNEQKAEMARRRKSRVKHGLRVLLRGTSRYQVLAFTTTGTLGSSVSVLADDPYVPASPWSVGGACSS